MRILIAEDDFASRKFMDKYLSQYGDCDATVDGEEAVNAYLMALEDEEPYDLVCLDVMMPIMNGYQVLEEIRKDEANRGVAKEERVKIIMTTALSGERMVDKAQKLECEAFAGKPINVEEFDKILRNLGLIN